MEINPTEWRKIEKQINPKGVNLLWWKVNGLDLTNKFRSYQKYQSETPELLYLSESLLDSFKCFRIICVFVRSTLKHWELFVFTLSVWMPSSIAYHLLHGKQKLKQTKFMREMSNLKWWQFTLCTQHIYIPNIYIYMPKLSIYIYIYIYIYIKVKWNVYKLKSS